MQRLHLTPDNHANIPPLSFYRPDAFPVAQPTASKHCVIKKTTVFNITRLLSVKKQQQTDILLCTLTTSQLKAYTKTAIIKIKYSTSIFTKYHC